MQKTSSTALRQQQQMYNQDNVLKVLKVDLIIRLLLLMQDVTNKQHIGLQCLLLNSKGNDALIEH